MQQNGHTTAEIQEEVALTNMGTTATAEKRNSDKLHFPRENLQTITVLGIHIQHINDRCHSSENVYVNEFIQQNKMSDIANVSVADILL